MDFSKIGEEDVPDVIELLDDLLGEVRGKAAIVLKNRLDEFPDVVRKAIPKLKERLDDGDKSARNGAACALGGLANKFPEEVRASVPKFVEMLDDQDRDARRYAVWALRNIARKFPEDVRAALPKLVKLSRETDVYLSSDVAEVVMKLGKLGVKPSGEAADVIRVDGFGGQVFEVPNTKEAIYELDIGKLWMKSIADRIAREIPSVRGYPLTAEPGEGPVFFVTLKGAEGDASAARELRATMEPIIREELDKESKKCACDITSVNKGGDLLFWCTVTLPPLGEG